MKHTHKSPEDEAEPDKIRAGGSVRCQIHHVSRAIGMTIGENRALIAERDPIRPSESPPDSVGCALDGPRVGANSPCLLRWEPRRPGGGAPPCYRSYRCYRKKGNPLPPPAPAAGSRCQTSSQGLFALRFVAFWHGGMTITLQGVRRKHDEPVKGGETEETERLTPAG